MTRYFLLICFLTIFLSSCQTSLENTEKTNEKPSKTYTSSEKIEKPEKVVKIISLEEFQNSNIEFKNLSEEQQNILIDTIINEMNLDEKIGQLFMLALRHTANGKPAYDADDYIKDYMDRYLPGGVILFSINFKNPDQTRNMIQNLQNHSHYPLFVSTDEEGGKVSRLGSTEAMKVISLPSASELSHYDSPELTEFAASVLAEDMRDLGFNMDMAPVADLRNRENNDVIGTRSFGSDPEQNAAMIASFVKGLQNNGISAVLKHFPGHGNVSGDSHEGAVYSLSSAEDFSKKEFTSFISGIAAGADFVLTAHIAAPALSGNSIPASLSPVIQTEILREKLGFEGIIITDAMDMGAIKNLYSPEEASLSAVLAGTDIILMPEHIPSAQQSIRDALEDGRLSEERLYSALKRIIKLKFNKGMFNLNYDYVKKISNTHKSLSHQSLETHLKTK